MSDASTSTNTSPGLLKVAERARREPRARFHALAYLMNEEALARAYRRLRSGAAVGVDGISKEQYGQAMEGNIRSLHGRLKARVYRHQPIRRVHIPKEQGKTRPIGVSTTEDKIVQGALRELLEAIYEQDFRDCSYGFRPRRSAHDAVRVLHRTLSRGGMHWVLEADIVSFFDSVNRAQLLEMLRERVADGSVLRLVGKCLHVGVLDGEEYSEPDRGTTQGSVLSPLLGNIYLHHVLDRWVEDEVRPRLRGKVVLVRYADDFVMTFQLRDDAERVAEVLPKRLGRFGLKLHPTKTRLLPFSRPALAVRGKGAATFDFLGFTWYWRRTRAGRWAVGCKTRSARLTRAICGVYDWCRQHRHEPVRQQHAALTRRLVGHANYFGVNGNARSLAVLIEQARRAWFKWLCRRSQRKRLNWKRFAEMLEVFPLPRARVVVNIWV